MNLADFLDEVGEGNSDWNDKQRKIIADMADKGEAWIGDINRDKDKRSSPTHTKWNGEMVYNFGASFVVPRFDELLDALIRARESTPYEGVKKDMVMVDAIIERIYAIGGKHLVWS